MANTEFGNLMVDIIASLGDAWSNYSKLRGDDQFPKAFHGAGRELKHVHHTLENIQSHGTFDRTVISENSVRALQACNAKAKLSAVTYAETARRHGSQRLEAYWLTVSQNGDGSTVESLVMGMVRDLQTLANVANVQATIRDSIQSLHDGVSDRLSALGSSAPNTQPPNVYNNNYGHGTQNNVSGGVQHNLTGSGNQFSGATFSGPVNFGRTE
ncbi:hypothetical protein BJX68DRAFT_262465 [Aspergillus pseudodeflectus]|uniref:NACHT-NTPase and P-loop NTPases N-terminal domain-containing protein n=1 Tax=Aspergillus pseudodeflectus TaxID=176178 RepID=A0ABR4L636_9EURO